MTKAAAKGTRSMVDFLVRHPQEFPTAANSSAGYLSDSEEYFKSTSAESVTEETAKVWMRYLGFELIEAQNGY